MVREIFIRSMPSRNSINKPSKKIQSKSHAVSLGKRRAARAGTTVATKSSTSRYNTKSKTAPKPTESKALALYTGQALDTAAVTSKSLSKKRAKKIARNQRYVQQRNGTAPDMEMDTEAQRETQIQRVKDSLWELVRAKKADKSTGLAVAVGEGTTLGVQAF